MARGDWSGMFMVASSGDVGMVNIPTIGEVGLDGGWEARAAWSRSCSRLRSRCKTENARSYHYFVRIPIECEIRNTRTKRDSNASHNWSNFSISRPREAVSERGGPGA